MSTHCAVTLVQEDLTPKVVAVYPRLSESPALGGTMMAVESLVRAMTFLLDRPFMARIRFDWAGGFPEVLPQKKSAQLRLYFV
jgi:hypothetical protein